eukprot:PhF_6_TR19002/c1_g1_i1/m.27846
MPTNNDSTPRVTTFGTAGLNTKFTLPKPPPSAPPIPELPLHKLNPASVRGPTFPTERRFGSANTNNAAATPKEVGPGSYTYDEIGACYGRRAPHKIPTTPATNLTVVHGHTVYCSSREAVAPGVGKYDLTKSTFTKGCSFPKAARGTSAEGVGRASSPTKLSAAGGNNNNTGPSSYDVEKAYDTLGISAIRKDKGFKMPLTSREGMGVNVSHGLLTYRPQRSKETTPGVGAYDISKATEMISPKKGITIPKQPLARGSSADDGNIIKKSSRHPNSLLATSPSPGSYETANFDTIASRASKSNAGKWSTTPREIGAKLQSGRLIYTSQHEVPVPGVGHYDIAAATTTTVQRASTSPTKKSRGDNHHHHHQPHPPPSSDAGVGPGSYFVENSVFDTKTYNVKLRKEAK